MKIPPIFDREVILENLRVIAITFILFITSYFESTYTFIVALFLSFLVNIFAGFKADEVKIKLKRIFPPIIWFENFKGNKFKDSLAELVLILVTIYSIKSISDLMGIGGSSIIAVKMLMWIAIYVYLRNSLRNLKIVYPKTLFFRILYSIVALKFRELFGNEISDIIEKEEKELEKENNEEGVDKNN